MALGIIQPELREPPALTRLLAELLKVVCWIFQLSPACLPVSLTKALQACVSAQAPSLKFPVTLRVYEQLPRSVQAHVQPLDCEISKRLSAHLTRAPILRKGPGADRV